MTEINNNNRLDYNVMIAKYMGENITTRNGEPAVYCIPDSAYAEYFRVSRFNKYHEDWNMLMPVVEKIINYQYEDGDNAYMRTFGMIHPEGGMLMVRINRSFLCTAETLIEATYMAVVDFIRWYNQQTEGVVTTSKQP